MDALLIGRLQERYEVVLKHLEAHDRQIEQMTTLMEQMTALLRSLTEGVTGKKVP